MDKKVFHLTAFFLFSILLIVLFSGCITEEHASETITEMVQPEVLLDQPSILPDWNDGECHNYFGTTKMLNGFDKQYPDLVKVFSLGKSVLGKDIWCIRVTNEKCKEDKSSCLIDGCIHGGEWEGGEVCLYLADYLLINFGENETITHVLNSSEVYLIPIINPDSRQLDFRLDDSRFNANGIDLNRNFDIDFGRLRGSVIPLGKLFNRISISTLPLNPSRNFTLIHRLFPRFPLWFTNCGRHPFSEPESQAMRDFMTNLGTKDFSFYVNCHCATHCIGYPWDAVKPPFEISKQEHFIYDYVLDWVVENTEYERVDDISSMDYKASGDVTDWCFKEFHTPSFYFEILSLDYNTKLVTSKHDHLVHWMQTTLPVFMYLLVNIDNLREWRTPDIQPHLPEGVPPEPL